MGWSLQSVPEFTDAQYGRWCELLEQRIGMQVAQHQRSFLQIQIARRMKELGYQEFDDYYDYVTGGIRGAMEWRQLIDRLVVRETSFFREPDSIEFVSQLLQRRIRERELGSGFDIWSLGCATGEEPYSLAMTLNDCFERKGLKPQFSITASDISQQAVQSAREGVYSNRKLERVPKEHRQKYFRDAEPGFMQIDASIRDRICFAWANLLELPKMPVVPMDVIYCQNVMIYFKRERRKAIVNELVTRLRPNGVLIIGMGELVDWSHPLIRRVRDDRVQAYIRVQ
ncbi:MAG: CheR family methyltransferase [Pseudomonadota bacterium]